MPQLENVVPQKTAGFVDSSPRRNRRLARLEEEEKALQKLINGGTDEEQEEPNGEGLETTEVQAESGAEQEEANTQGQAPEENDDDSNLTAEEKSFKKRYGDLRRYSAEKEKDLKAKIEALEGQLKGGNTKSVRPPASDEDLDAWAKKYPDVASIVETIAQKKAQELFAKAEGALNHYQEAQYEAQRVSAENQIRQAHADFDDLRSSDAFHNWAAEQPKWVQDALYENSDDPASVIRVIDLYKVDNGMTAKDLKAKSKEAAKTVTKGQRTAIDADSSSGTFKESQVARMSNKEYEANMEAIDAAIRSGKFIYDLSGGAR